MNTVLKKLALEAGGSHYPHVNTMQLEYFYRLMIQEFVGLLDRSDQLTPADVLAHFNLTDNESIKTSN